MITVGPLFVTKTQSGAVNEAIGSVLSSPVFNFGNEIVLVPPRQGDIDRVWGLAEGEGDVVELTAEAKLGTAGAESVSN